MDDLIKEQKNKIRDYPNANQYKRGLEHMSYVREKVWIRYCSINKGDL